MSKDRLASLKRIEAVQKRMVALANMRLAAAERLCRDIAEDKAILNDFVGQQEAVSASFSRAVLRTSLSIDDRLARATTLRERQRSQLDQLKQREHAVGSLVADEQLVVRRLEEDRDLRETMEAWQARHHASLR